MDLEGRCGYIEFLEDDDIKVYWLPVWWCKWHLLFSTKEKLSVRELHCVNLLCFSGVVALFIHGEFTPGLVGAPCVLRLSCDGA